MNVQLRSFAPSFPLPLQVTEATANILRANEFVVEKRGLVPVKGKGELTTYFVISEPRK